LSLTGCRKVIYLSFQARKYL